LWNVHVHVDDVGAAIEAGLDAGRPHRISVTHFDEQRGRGSAADTGAPQQPTSAGGAGAVGRTRSGRTVVASAAGPGVADLFTEAGAAVVTSQPYRRPSTGQLLEAVLATGAGEVILLPNDPDSVATAEAASRLAAEEKGVRVAVVPTHAQVQGLAALAVHEPGRTFEQDVLAMTAAARHARSGAVTVAAKRAITTAGPCEPGDVLGAIEGDFVVVGGDVFAVAVEVLERLLGGGGELVTLLAGEGGGDLAHRCAEHICAHHPTVDVVVYDGGQERYPLLVAVE
jgi:dihydroxyacetone kinase-like predicted kinase